MKKLLALNRGEIATVFRAATELGFSTVAVYSQEDRLSLHRFKADEAYLIGQGKGPVQAYLDVDAIVALAGKERRHPPSRLRFLSENPALPRACEKAGITFVGPSAALLELWATKRRPASWRSKAGIPWFPEPKSRSTEPRDAEDRAAASASR